MDGRRTETTREAGGNFPPALDYRTYRGAAADFQPGASNSFAPSMALLRTAPANRSRSRSAASALRAIAFIAALLCLGLAAAPKAHAQAAATTDTLRIVALGDSLTAGLGVAQNEAFPAQLQRALLEKGYKVEVINAGVSGDTASGGLARVEWSVPDHVAGVIVELGANDALRGIDPDVTSKALDDILSRLRSRDIPVLLAGMRAPRNLGPDYAQRFDAIYPALAAKHGVIFYPFFLEGVAAERNLNQKDGIHPTAEGVAVIVRGILPQVEELLARAGKQTKR